MFRKFWRRILRALGGKPDGETEVVVTITVDDEDAQKKLAEMKARVEALAAAFGRLSDSADHVAPQFATFNEVAKGVPIEEQEAKDVS